MTRPGTEDRTLQPLHPVLAGERLGRALFSDDRGIYGFDESFDIPGVWLTIEV
jgi:hypothetical protein